ncbi:glycosyl hydrolase family 28-related protein [Ligilactobacillus pobuzihii]|uniref:glycosyl hydrolase family 28-related protein n=1 Tax=Ligilactobacillus pobuzihii TaxID=449659 RepID=UPI0019D2CD49|nr:glycosyl hydrolase family 28-related protein [Ligilactobacillus pobuzihii]
MSWHKLSETLKKLDLKNEASPFQNREMRIRHQHNWNSLRGWGKGFAKDIDNYMTNVDQRIDDQLNANTFKDEEIDFRHSDMLQHSFKTMRKRGDFWDDEFQFRGVNVRWFGAAGDGVTDDTQAFQAALDYDTGKTDFLYIPIGTYLISKKLVLTKNIKAERGAKLICGTQGLNYMFRATSDSLYITGLTVDMQEGRGVFSCDELDYVEFVDCDLTGYSIKGGHYNTDSGILLNNVKESYFKNVRFHDHGAQYGTAENELNRCVTIQGEGCKLARFDDIVIERANQGIVAEGKNLTLSINDSYLTETHDNSLYLNVDMANINNVIFTDKFDESCVVCGGIYIFNNCTFRDCPGRIIAISGNTQMVNVENCNFLQTNGYHGQPVTFRSINYRLNSLTIKDNRMNLHPTLDTDDIFMFGQIDFFDIIDNVIKTATIQSGQRLFSFRNTDGARLYGKIVNNSLLPLESADNFSTTSTFADFFKDNNSVYIEGNVTSGARIPLVRSGISVNDQRVQANIGPYAMGLSDRQTSVSAGEVPQKGTWKTGTIVYNEAPSVDHPTLCWVRITNGSSNVLGKDWISIQGK